MSRGDCPRRGWGRMHQVMAGHVKRGEAPGAVTLVSRDAGTSNPVVGEALAAICRAD